MYDQFLLITIVLMAIFVLRKASPMNKSDQLGQFIDLRKLQKNFQATDQDHQQNNTVNALDTQNDQYGVVKKRTHSIDLGTPRKKSNILSCQNYMGQSSSESKRSDDKTEQQNFNEMAALSSPKASNGMPISDFCYEIFGDDQFNNLTSYLDEIDGFESNLFDGLLQENDEQFPITDFKITEKQFSGSNQTLAEQYDEANTSRTVSEQLQQGKNIENTQEKSIGSDQGTNSNSENFQGPIPDHNIVVVQSPEQHEYTVLHQEREKEIKIDTVSVQPKRKSPNKGASKKIKENRKKAFDDSQTKPTQKVKPNSEKQHQKIKQVLSVTKGVQKSTSAMANHGQKLKKSNSFSKMLNNENVEHVLTKPIPGSSHTANYQRQSNASSPINIQTAHMTVSSPANPTQIQTGTSNSPDLGWKTQKSLPKLNMTKVAKLLDINQNSPQYSNSPTTVLNPGTVPNSPLMSSQPRTPTYFSPTDMRLSAFANQLQLSRLNMPSVPQPNIVSDPQQNTVYEQPSLVVTELNSPLFNSGPNSAENQNQSMFNIREKMMMSPLSLEGSIMAQKRLQFDTEDNNTVHSQQTQNLTNPTMPNQPGTVFPATVPVQLGAVANLKYSPAVIDATIKRLNSQGFMIPSSFMLLPQNDNVANNHAGINQPAANKPLYKVPAPPTMRQTENANIANAVYNTADRLQSQHSVSDYLNRQNLPLYSNLATTVASTSQSVSSTNNNYAEAGHYNSISPTVDATVKSMPPPQFSNPFASKSQNMNATDQLLAINKAARNLWTSQQNPTTNVTISGLRLPQLPITDANVRQLNSQPNNATVYMPPQQLSNPIASTSQNLSATDHLLAINEAARNYLRSQQNPTTNVTVSGLRPSQFAVADTNVKQLNSQPNNATVSGLTTEQMATADAAVKRLNSQPNTVSNATVSDLTPEQWALVEASVKRLTSKHADDANIATVKGQTPTRVATVIDNTVHSSQIQSATNAGRDAQPINSPQNNVLTRQSSLEFINEQSFITAANKTAAKGTYLRKSHSTTVPHSIFTVPPVPQFGKSTPIGNNPAEAQIQNQIIEPLNTVPTTIIPSLAVGGKVGETSDNLKIEQLSIGLELAKLALNATIPPLIIGTTATHVNDYKQILKMNFACLMLNKSELDIDQLYQNAINSNFSREIVGIFFQIIKMAIDRQNEKPDYGDKMLWNANIYLRIYKKVYEFKNASSSTDDILVKIFIKTGAIQLQTMLIEWHNFRGNFPMLRADGTAQQAFKKGYFKKHCLYLINNWQLF